MMLQSRPSLSSSIHLIIAFSLSVAVVLGGLFLGWNAHGPEAVGCVGGFSCLSANEWGDYLAGISAPVAFIWLVTAVLIQSKELAEQRRELALTRQEFELNRKVLEEQAQAIKVQTEALVQDRHTEELRERIRNLRILVEQHFRVWGQVADGLDHRGYPNYVEGDVGFLTKDMPPEPLTYFTEICRRIAETFRLKRSERKHSETVWFDNASDVHIYALGQRLEALLNLSGRVSPVAVAVLSDPEFNFVLANFPEITPEMLAEAEAEKWTDF